MSKETEPANSGVLLLITRPSLQAAALGNHCKSTFGINVKIHNIQKPLTPIVAERLWIIFDLSETDRKNAMLWQSSLQRLRDRARVLLINVPDDYTFQEVDSWPGISAVFYLSADENTLIDGVRRVLNGGSHFSESLTQHFARGTNNFHYHNDAAGLTHREKDILNKLSMGASNIEIARLLFISENTVKTHLYNLFRKISVKNRTQAVSWANDNLRR